MDKPTDEQLRAIGSAKALALGIYGEDMAAYGYLLLAEKADREQDRLVFGAMVTEEQGHRDGLQVLLDKHFPGADFVLTPAEKQMVESASRGIQITDRASYEKALRQVIESEHMTAQFYGRMAPHITEPEIQAVFRELAKEGVEHHQRLQRIAAENNIPLK